MRVGHWQAAVFSYKEMEALARGKHADSEFGSKKPHEILALRVRDLGFVHPRRV